MADPEEDKKMAADDDDAMDQDERNDEENDKENDAKEAGDSQETMEEEGDAEVAAAGDSQETNAENSNAAKDDEEASASDSDEESSSSDEESDDEDESQPNVASAPVIGEDGHALSAYEIQRLERIRRNKEYLASLGLEKNKPSMPAKPAKKANPARRKPPDIKRRSSISRASKDKAITYSERKKDQEETASGDAKKKEPWTRPKENRAARMERFIHDEFRRIGKEQRHHLKRAKKNVRQADVEYRIALKRAEQYEKRTRRHLEYKQSFEKMQEERRALGGSTAREMLMQIDSHQYEISQALVAFDERFNHQGNMAEWAKQQEENQRKMEIFDAIDLFPKTYKEAIHELDILLTERSPKDPPPPRRGTRKRKTLDSPKVEEVEPEPDTKMRAMESPEGSNAKLAAGNAWGSLASAITAETLSSAGTHLDKPSPTTVLEDSDSKPAAQAKPKKKKREVIPKNVGGWVSPAFANDIDRSWLEADTSPKKFEATSYIPQVGDTVLYYPAGHRSFLKVNPDILGKKTRNVTRMTLWDRAKKEKAKLAKTAEEKGEKETAQDEGSKPSRWWNEEWLSLIDGDLDRYPILCRVEKTHAEFPPDPEAENKIVTKDDEGGAVQIIWKAKKDGQPKKRTNPALRLAVMLRPLTPVVPPQQGTEGTSDALTLPPSFYVVSFPSKVSPFIVPFSWAYRLAHGLSDGQSIRLSSKPEWRGKVTSFRSLEDGHGSSRFDDKMGSIRELCDGLKRGPKSFAVSLEEALSSDGRAVIPITDACAVIERFETAVLNASDAANDASSGAANDTSSGSPSIRPAKGAMMHLIRGTFPLWKEVVVQSGSGKKLAMSAWELSPIESKPSAPVGWTSADIDAETGLVYSLDVPLRAKIECTIEDFLKDTPDAAMFCPLVTDEEAPSYSCAVPRGMAFNKILHRLRSGRKPGQTRCYYRSIDSLLGDVSAILDNCVLYNSPDSFVVEKALEVVPSIKRLIADVASRHLKEKEARERSAEERRQAILMQCNAPALLDDEDGRNESTSRSRSVKRQLQQPYPEFLHRSWIQDTEPDKSWSSVHQSDELASNEAKTGIAEALANGGWVPQRGDTVFYSRSLHTEFVKGHHPSLTTEQCSVPRFSGESDGTEQQGSDGISGASENDLCDNLQNRWLVGKVAWVRAAFPRSPSKRDSDYEDTFDVASPVLDLGIRFIYSWAPSKIYKVSWRPCAFAMNQPLANEATPSTSARSKRSEERGSDLAVGATAEESKPAPSCKCKACQLNVDASFVRPAWVPISNEGSTDDEGGGSSPYILPDHSLPAAILFALPSGIAKDTISSIDRCLNALKRRCLDGVPANHVDPKFSTENVKKGWCPPAAKIGKSLPTFDRLLAKGNSGGSDASTRGVEKVDKHSVKLLVDANYLPQWTSSLSEGTSKKTNRDGIVQSLAMHETLSPNPNFCLEFIQTRLRNGYYRCAGSLAHDIEEAYVSSVMLLLMKPALAKQGQAVSIRRIARALSSTKDVISFPKSSGKKSAKKAASSKESVASSEAGKKVVAKNNPLTEKEQKWVEKLIQIRQLYSMAYASAIQPGCMERIFGTVPKKKITSAITSEPKTVDEREQTFRKARNTLGFIYQSFLRDPCDNRPATASWNPSVKVRVKFSGQDAVEGASVAKGVPQGGSEVDSQPEPDVDTTKPIVIEASDYEDNDTLVKFFFGRPGRTESCGRCSAYGRGTMMCRVRKKHALPDFDWASVFEGTGGINGLLYTMRTGQPPPTMMVSAPSLAAAPALLPSDEAATAAGDIVGVDTNKPDPSALLEKALETVAFADKVMEKAQKFSVAPVRLSEEFVGLTFPIDPADGHYNYCILCGLIGDVVCCEGCPNVVHPRCVHLAEIPEEDWYCSKCRREGKCASAEKKVEGEENLDSQKPPAASAEASSEEKKEASIPQKPSAASVAATADVLPRSMAAPDGLDDDADNLEAMLGELKSARPIRPKKPKKETKTSDQEKKRDDGDDDDPGSPSGKRPSSPVDDEGAGSAVDESDDEDLAPRRRRRARRRVSEDDADEDASVQAVQRIRVGMKVKKSFGKHGSYFGKVLECPTSENPFYLVRYEDDDEEDMEEDELKKYILAARKCKRASGSRGKKAEEEGGEELGEEEAPPSEPAKTRGRHKRTRSSAAAEEPDVAATNQAEKKKRGRPRRTQSSAPSEDPESPKKKRGRPPRDDAEGTPAKRGRGRPPKQKRGRGRPRKQS